MSTEPLPAASSEAAQQLFGIEQPSASGGQLHGKRQALEATADLHRRLGVLLVQGEAGAHGAGPVDEQGHSR
jgi:hypothetical protein